MDIKELRRIEEEGRCSSLLFQIEKQVTRLDKFVRDTSDYKRRDGVNFDEVVAKYENDITMLVRALYKKEGLDHPNQEFEKKAWNREKINFLLAFGLALLSITAISFIYEHCL